MDHPFAITLEPDTGRANLTGTWRAMRPRYHHFLPPCNQACPAGENIQQWLALVEEGRYEDAWQKIMEENPLPAVHGRICYHPCEGGCNRSGLDEAVGIHSVERFLGDMALENHWQVTCAPDTGWSVRVIGSGPCGLACAYHLRRMGHAVHLCESMPEAGGMLRYGIPAYRLPRHVLAAEIDRLVQMGVMLETDCPVTDPTGSLQLGRIDAVFLAIGAHRGRRITLQVDGPTRVLDAVDFLRDSADRVPAHADALSDQAPQRPMLLNPGERVVVYGGGNTALDAARSALRLGAARVTIVYRRDIAHMPGHASELEDALVEGVHFQELTTIVEGREGQLKLEAMRLDERGFPQPTGQFDAMPADTLILALGQETESDFLRGLPGLDVRADGVVRVDEQMRTGFPGLFAGGDMVPSNRTAATAVGHGKKAARHIDAFLRGATFEPAPAPPVAEADRLNIWYYPTSPRHAEPKLSLRLRRSGFGEIVGPLRETQARSEANRCLSCGNCMACDNCYGMCPDNAIRKLASGLFEIDLDYCKGCGICVNECPCGCMTLEREPA